MWISVFFSYRKRSRKGFSVYSDTDNHVNVVTGTTPLVGSIGIRIGIVCVTTPFTVVQGKINIRGIGCPLFFVFGC